MAQQIDPQRLRVLPRLRLDVGAHLDFRKGHCAMEAVAWLLDCPHSDAPECIDGSLASYVRSLNDHLDDHERQRLLPLIPAIATTTRQNSPHIHRVLTDSSTHFVRRWIDLSEYTDDDFDPRNGRSIAICESLADQITHASGDERAELYARLVAFTLALFEYFSNYTLTDRLLPTTSLTVSYVKNTSGHLTFDPTIRDELDTLMANHPAFGDYRRVRAERVDDALDILSRLIGPHHG